MCSSTLMEKTSKGNLFLIWILPSLMLASPLSFTTPIHIQQPILNISRVAIVVFTESYSQSVWCLHQLQQIIKWHQTYCRHLLPVYYEIQPSDVRLQIGDFGKAFKATAQQTFSGQQLEHGMSSWSHALTKAANFFGWDESNHGSDAELVQKIVKSVLNLPVLSATKFPVGLQSRVEDVIRIIKNKSIQVFTIAICGMGGSGKTTLAKAIYNQIHGTFTKKSFIEDITQVIQTRGLVHLQEQLLSDILKTKVKISSAEMGRSMIRERLHGKRVLVVLDDVKKYDPLDLWEISQWFGEGSVLIITTRDEDLPRIHHVDSVFGINLMNSNESLELLSWHAFREPKPKEQYHFFAKEVVAYCGGLPLALEVIGTYLYERTREEWNRVLLRLDNIPSHKIPQILKISFDRLDNQMEKDLFLDVCCFFVDKDRAYVTKILNGCGIDADSGIRVLIERSLIQVKKNNKFGMHHLLREMRREIILEHGKSSPQWLDSDEKYTLSENIEIKVIERWPFTRKYPVEVLTCLKVLNLSHCKYLIETPDFSGLPSLEQLILKDCPRLREVHPSIGCLCNLMLLNLKDCTSLCNLPIQICNLKSLKTLILSGCSKIDILEKHIVQMESLRILIVENTAVKQLPFTIVCSKSIGYLSLPRFERFSHNLFPSIVRSRMPQPINPLSYINSFMDMEDNSWDDIAPLLSNLANLRSVLVQCDAEFQLSEQVKTILAEYGGNVNESGISKHDLRSSLTGVGRYKEFFNSVFASSESCVSLPGDNDPYWLAHIGDGHSVSFTVPQDRVVKGMAFCVVYLSTSEIIEPELTTVLIVNYTKCTCQIHNHGTLISFNDDDWPDIMSNLGSEDKVEIFVTFGNGLVVKNTAVYLICSESNDLEKKPVPKKNSFIRFIKNIVM